MVATAPPSEGRRLASLRSLKIYETLAEDRFDDLVSIAADILEVPISLISLIEEDAQWFKAKIGTDVCGTSRDVAFCAHAILGTGPLIVRDARLDPRFSDNPLVTGEFGLVFYMGVPVLFEGMPIGTICCIDRVPKVPTDRQIAGLQKLARQVGELLDARYLSSSLQSALETTRQAEQISRIAARKFNCFFESIPIACFTYGPDGIIQEWNAAATRLYGMPAKQAIGRPVIGTAVCEANRSTAAKIASAAFRGEPTTAFEHPENLRDGRKVWVVTSVTPLRDALGEITLALSSNLDITDAKNAADELARTKENLSWSQSITKVGSFERDLTTDEIKWSPQMFVNHGLAWSENAPPFSEVAHRIHPDDLERVKQFLADRQSDWSQGTVEFRFFTESEERVLQTHYHPSKLSGKVSAAVVDVTESVHTANELRDAKQFAESIIQSSPSLLYIFDLDRGNCTWANVDLASFLGVSHEEFETYGQCLLESVIHPEDLARVSSAMSEISQAKDGCVEFECRIQTGSGDWRWIATKASPYRRRTDGTVCQIMGAGLDITDRKLAEAALRDSETRFGSAIQAMHEGLVVQDNSGEILVVNNRACEILGLTNDQLRGKSSLDPDWECFHDDLTPWPGEMHPTMVALKEGIPNSGQIMGIRRPSGEVIWIEVNAIPLFHPGLTTPHAVVCTFSDITKHRLQEELIGKHLLQIKAHSQELEAKNREVISSNDELMRFAFAASHDLVEPLRMVNSFLELLNDEYGNQLDEQGREFIWFARDGAERMRQLITDLLEFSKVGMQKIQPISVDLRDVFEEAIQNLAIAINESHANIQAVGLSVVEGDRSQLVRLFQNLLSNSLKFRDPADCQIQIFACLEDGIVRVNIADNGIGIDPRFLDQVFGLFQRLQGRDKYPGSGIGLSLCRRIVERHGGTIQVDPGTNLGTSITFSLPCAA